MTFDLVWTDSAGKQRRYDGLTGERAEAYVRQPFGCLDPDFIAAVRKCLDGAAIASEQNAL